MAGSPDNSGYRWPVPFPGGLGLAAVILAGSVFVGLRWLEFPVGAGMDDAYYIELARSLAEGRGPVIHLNDIIPDWRPDLFPVGYPLLLSPLALLFDGSVHVFKLVGLLAMTALVPLCLLLARSAGIGRGPALAALVCLNPWTVAFSVRVFSDVPFTAASVAAVWLFLQVTEDDRPGKAKFTALILVTGGAIMLRTIGFALPVAMVLTWLRLKRWPSALWFAGGLALVIAAQVLINGIPGGGLITSGYVQQVFVNGEGPAGRSALWWGNLIGYLKEISVVVLPFFGRPLETVAAEAGMGALYGPLQLVTGIMILTASLWGWMKAAGRHSSRFLFPLIYLAVYGAVLLNFSGYPSGVQTRLLLPILPILYLGLIGCFVDRGRRAVPVSLLALVLVISAGHNIYRAARPLRGGAPDPGRHFIDPTPGAGWIKTHTDGDQVIMTRWPLRQHIHHRRPVVGYGSTDSRDLDARVEMFGVDYVVVGQGEADPVMREVREWLEAAPDRFGVVHRDPTGGATIFRVGP